MIYRDAGVALRERLGRLRAEAARLRAIPVPREARLLAAQLRRRRRELSRARRVVARLRHPVLRLLPRSAVEIVVALGLAYTMLLTLGLGALVVGALAMPLL
jgi:hypothetical protein